MARDSGIFPELYVPESEKTESWAKKVLNAIDDYYDDFYDSERIKDWDNYNLFSGDTDAKEFEYLTNTYGVTSPSRYVNYPLIQPKIDLLVGEFIQQPLKFSVKVINEDAVYRKYDKKVTLMAKKLIQPYVQEIEEMTGIQLEEEDVANMEIPEHIEKFNERNFRENNEEIIYHGLRYLKHRYNMKDEFKRGLYDLCITNKSFYKCDIINGDPQVRRVDPRNLIYDMDVDTESAEDFEWIGEDRHMTVSEIIEEFREWLDEDQVKKLDKMRQTSEDEISDAYSNANLSKYYNFDESGRGVDDIRVLQAEWRAIRKIRVVIQDDNPIDDKVPFLKFVDKDYEPKEGERIETRFIQDVWEGTKIGGEMYVRMRRRPNQIRSETMGYANTQLSYKGVIRNNFTTNTVSIVDSMKNIQLFYNLVMYHIELALSRSAGKAVVYDTAMKPEGFDMNDIIYHAKNHGLIAVNSMQEGGQYRHPFNQFQQVDFTLSNAVTQLINLKIVLEDTANKLTGINPARQGFVNKGELVGTTESSITQSSLVTQPIFRAHNRAIEDVLQYLADLMKVAWSKRERMSFVFGEEGIKFFDIDDSLNKEDFGIFVDNTYEESHKKQQMAQLSQAAMSSGQVGIKEAIKILNADTSKEAEQILEESVQSMEEIKQRIEQEKVANERAKMKIEQADIKKDYDVARLEADTDIAVARIKAGENIEKETMRIRGSLEQEDLRRKTKLDEKAMDIHHSEGGGDESAGNPRKEKQPKQGNKSE